MAIAALSIEHTANEVARALVRVSAREESVRLSLPLLYPGGSMVGIELSRLRSGFLVSDAGAARLVYWAANESSTASRRM